MRDVISLLDSAIEALAFAHAQGVVHRDLNPGNLFLARTPAGTKLKILDFGVAKIMADAAIEMGPTARTVGNVRMFAPAYGAPEQFDDRLGAIGPWTDVYSVGLVILEALADRTVMEGDHLGEFAAKALDTTRRPTPRTFGVAVGDETEKLLAFALSLDPRRRPSDAGELWGMLKHAIQVDARSGRLPHSDPPAVDESPATLRMDERAPERASGAGGEAEPDDPGLPRPLGGTLRMDPGGRRAQPSASEFLAATPVPPRVSVAPPPATSLPDNSQPLAFLGLSDSSPTYGSASRPPRVAVWVVGVLVVVAALMGAVAYGLHAWSAGMAIPAEHP